jgi:hypothetical protein
MNCGCGTRAGKLLRWLGFSYEDPNRWHFAGSQGRLVVELDISTQHTRLSLLALVARILLG